VFLPVDTLDADGARLRAEGWVTVRALESFDSPAAEARRLHCTHIFASGQIVPAV
jgi:ATP phosphoribosyltransferase regulatory subunit